MKFAIALALLVAAPVSAQAPASFPEQFAAMLREKLPMSFDSGFVMTDAAVRDGILVVLVEDRAGLAGTMPSEQVASEMATGLAAGFCEGDGRAARDAFDKGLRLRADVLRTSGERVAGPVLDRCP